MKQIKKTTHCHKEMRLECDNNIAQQFVNVDKRIDDRSESINRRIDTIEWLLKFILSAILAILCLSV